jgi:hypothetical protein
LAQPRTASSPGVWRRSPPSSSTFLIDHDICPTTKTSGVGTWSSTSSDWESAGNLLENVLRARVQVVDEGF